VILDETPEGAEGAEAIVLLKVSEQVANIVPMRRELKGGERGEREEIFAGNDTAVMQRTSGSPHYSTPAPRAHWYLAPSTATGSSVVYG
jgi:hypothetical protein